MMVEVAFWLAVQVQKVKVKNDKIQEIVVSATTVCVQSPVMQLSAWCRG